MTYTATANTRPYYTWERRWCRWFHGLYGLSFGGLLYAFRQYKGRIVICEYVCNLCEQPWPQDKQIENGYEEDDRKRGSMQLHADRHGLKLD